MARIGGPFLLLALLTVAAFTALTAHQARKALLDSALARLDAVAVLKQDELERWIEDQRSHVRLVAQLPELRRGVPELVAGARHAAARERVADLLAVLGGGKPDIREALVLSDAGGRVLASTRRQNEESYRVDAVFFQRGRLSTFVQGAYLSPDTLEPTITIATPLNDLAGERLGVLAVHLDLNRVDEIVGERSGLGSSGESYLVNLSGDFVSARRFGRPAFPRGAHSRGIDEALGGRSGSGLYRNYAGEPVIGSYRWLENRDLALVVEIQQAEAFAPARAQAATILVAGLSSAGVLALGILLLSRRLVRPILAVTEAATAVAHGDLSREAPVVSADEVGTLARTFNAMTAQLRLLYERLEQQLVELERARAALEVSEERYALAVSGAQDGIWDWHLETGEVYYSARFKALLGCVEGQIGPRLEDWHGRVHPEDRDGLKAAIARHLAGAAPHIENEHRLRHADGGDRWMLCRGLAVRDAAGRPVRVAGSLSDVTEWKRVEAELLRSSFYDSLTGLPNRALFMDRLGHALALARREGSGYRFAVLLLDLDRFEQANSSLGHAVGDQLLRGVASRLSGLARAGDTVARMGGDEFAMLVDVTDGVDPGALAERIHDELGAPFHSDGHDAIVTASIGIVREAAAYRRPDEVLRDAETAVYDAKARGRACYVVFDEPRG